MHLCPGALHNRRVLLVPVVGVGVGVVYGNGDAEDVDDVDDVDGVAAVVVRQGIEEDDDEANDEGWDAGNT